jgi:hypothetical protein
MRARNGQKWLAHWCVTVDTGGMAGDDKRRLLRTPPTGLNWRNTASIGGSWEDDGTLAMGFLEAADILVERWKSGRRGLTVPILANYRHGIELVLKDAIRDTAACLRDDGCDDPELLPDAVNHELASTHSIGRLTGNLTSYLDRLQLGPEDRLPADTIDVLGSLHVLDESGQEFRYSTVKTRNGKQVKLIRAWPNEIHFDLIAVAEALRDAATMVLYGVSGVLDQYAEWQGYMREQAGY